MTSTKAFDTMYIIEQTIGFCTDTFTLCDIGDLVMAHKTRSEQLANHTFKTRKDPRKIARETKPHTPKNVYKRVHNVLKEYYESE